MPRKRASRAQQDDVPNDVQLATEGAPCPNDMTPAEWAEFVHGKQCTVCRQPATKDVYWCLRARLCVDCEITRLTDISMDWSALTPPVVCDWVRKRNDKKVRTQGKYDMKLKGWTEDVNAVKTSIPNSRSDGARQQLDDLAAQLHERRQHAKACQEWHNVQKQEHKDHLERLREKRASEIISRLKALGYKKKDMEWGCSIQKWTGVRTAKALTERAVFFNMPGPVYPLIKRAPRLTDETRHELEMAVMSSVPAIQQQILRKGELFSQAIPRDWPRPPPAHYSAAPTTDHHTYSATSVEVYTKLAPLDLAIYTFSCPQKECSETVLHGLDVVAHRCNGGKYAPQVDGVLDDSSGKSQSRLDSQAAVMRILLMLGLDPLQTTPLDLDKRGLGFMTTCTACNRESSHWDNTNWQLPLTWRAVVKRMSSQDSEHHCDWREIYPIARNEAFAMHHGRTSPVRYGDEGLHVDVHTRRRWGCAHCSVHVLTAKTPPYSGPHFIELMGRTSILIHLAEQHGKSVKDIEEGVDFFYDRGLRGSREDSDEFL
ncbi:hypothetical protein PENSPDRAFT_731525 [Peniophora sp. CONT]|nr:hypothetical protein PENSPDRAFT_731525 [Peniophora sp. CONT]